MKRKELLREIRENGAHPFKKGGEHKKWKTKTGKLLIIPNGSEINEYTAKAILKDSTQ